MHRLSKSNHLKAFLPPTSMNYIVPLIVLFASSLISRHEEHNEVYQHLNPIETPPNPYRKTTPLLDSPSAVCGILFTSDKRAYRTLTFASSKDAEIAHAHITHLGSCGTCSSLQDLNVYRAKPDLTKPAQKCALLSWLPSASILCFKRMGLSEPCAQSWYFNAQNTRKKCLWTCLASFIKGEASNKADGSLNDCLQCDENESGPGFVQSAGRTRRNSGLSSSIKRSQEQIAPIVHDYF